MQVKADLSSENVNWHLILLMVLEYGCALFLTGVKLVADT